MEQEYKANLAKSNVALCSSTRKELETNSLKKHEATKKNKKVMLNDAKDKMSKVVVGVMIVGASALGVFVTQKIIDHNKREKEFEDASAYMKEYIMPGLLTDSGFVVTTTEDGYIYYFDSSDIANAKQNLMYNYGFTDSTAELALAEYYNYSDALYTVRGYEDSYDFYKKLGYKNKDALDNIVYTPQDIFINMNEVQYVKHVKELQKQEEGVNDARS